MAATGRERGVGGPVDRQVSRHVHALASVWRDGLDCGGKSSMGCRINGPMLDLAAGGILPEAVVAFPVLRRPDWSGNEATPAVRAHVLQDRIDTGGAKGAFIGTDACFERVRRQRPVAVLTGRPEFKHTGSFMVTANSD